jgi:hypothetical protein
LLLALSSSSLFSQNLKRSAENARLSTTDNFKAVETAPPTLGITVEKYVMSYDVRGDGTSVKTWEMQQRFDSDLVIDRFKKFERSFNGDLQRAEVLEAYILKADGTRVALEADAVQIEPTPQAEAAPSFSSYKQIQIHYGALQKGDATYFKVRLTTLKPHFERQFDFLEVFPLGYAWKSIEVTSRRPPIFRFTFRRSNWKEVACATKTRGHAGNGGAKI